MKNAGVAPATTLPIRRALLSVYDKTGVAELARGLATAGAELISTGGTARTLREASLAIKEVSELTGFPEMLDGRVKTLHPVVHLGLLARRAVPEHMRQAAAHGIGMIDLLAVNLYPFERTVIARLGKGEAGIDPEIIEMIDIGGPAMIRSASKNFHDVVVLVDPTDYGSVLSEIASMGGVTLETRIHLAAKAFAHTAAYDAAIAEWMAQFVAAGAQAATSLLPDVLTLGYIKERDLRYGENPHQAAALYRAPLDTSPSAVAARQVQGKELSYNNILDLDAAWSLAREFTPPACAIIKHTNPAGVALGGGPAEAWRLALACDSVSAFGGIVAFNCVVTAEAARELSTIFLEAIIAPGYEPEALAVLSSKKHLRVMEAGQASRPAAGRDFRRVEGGLLVQDLDRSIEAAADLKVVTRRGPSPGEVQSLLFAWTVARHVKSNAIVFAHGTATAGVGAGQMSRVDAVRFGAAKAAVTLSGAALASDAFFPFRDGIDEAAKAGVAAVIQPGGSVKDAEVIAAADEHGMAMVFTGRRHFRH